MFFRYLFVRKLELVEDVIQGKAGSWGVNGIVRVLICPLVLSYSMAIEI